MDNWQKIIVEGIVSYKKDMAALRRDVDELREGYNRIDKRFEIACKNERKKLWNLIIDNPNYRVGDSSNFIYLADLKRIIFGDAK